MSLNLFFPEAFDYERLPEPIPVLHFPNPSPRFSGKHFKKSVDIFGDHMMDGKFSSNSGTLSIFAMGRTKSKSGQPMAVRESAIFNLPFIRGLIHGK
ncbi:hypothetical protein [Desulfocicer vacuolatum]|uniref:hypothetical protein n=1 Tax=Desulfocicer vacuolatum TaxID=2298 RepID=UPI000A0739CF|nr:hypothetical protein [Desulfocicer vacuolatum]